MTKVDVLSIKGEKTGLVDFPATIFEAKINPILMAQAVRVYLANQRQATAKVKTRAQVTGTTAKVWRQKGTGRARHGSRKAPIFVGGGVAHGPNGQQNYHLKLSQQMKRAALFSALSYKLREKQLLVVDGFEDIEPKTKAMVDSLKHLQVTGRSTLVFSGKAEGLFRAGGNLAKLNLLNIDNLNTYSVLNAGWLILIKSVLPVLTARYHLEPVKPLPIKATAKTKKIIKSATKKTK